MAKKKYEVIDIDNMTGNISIASSKNNTLDFNGKTWTQAIAKISADGDNLVITTTNANGYKVILTDYFAKNGKHSIKYINTSGAGESDLAILDIVNSKNISGTSQIIDKATKGKFNGTVFNDTITGSEFADKIYGNGGNDTIDGGGQNDTISGGEGTNTIILYTGKKFGDDTVTLTKGEHLYFKLADSTSLSAVQSEIVGKDLVITVNKGQTGLESSVTIKNYTKKDVLTSAGELKILDKNGEELYDFRDGFYQKTYMDAGVGHYNKSSFTGTWIDDEVTAEEYVTTVKKGKTEETTKGVTINLGGATDYNDAIGSKYADTIKGGANDDDIEGGKGNDNITGGAGENIIVYHIGDGHDTINLSKDEELTIELGDLALSNVKIEYANKNKDVKIWYADNGAEAGSLTLKNFAKKDVTKYVKIKDKNGDYYNFDGDGDYIKTVVNKSNFTGTIQNDFIDASESEELVKKNKHVNMVLNGGKGDDYILGSIYADTLKGGDGDDILEGGKGDDLLYGEKGKNIFVFNTGDGVDTVYSGKGEDTLRFVGDDNIQDLLNFEIANNQKDLIIYYGMDRQSYITVKDYFKKQALNPACSVKYVQFGEDGDLLDIETVRKESEGHKGTVVEGSGDNFDIKAETKYVIGSLVDDNIDLNDSQQSSVTVAASEGTNSVTGKSGDVTVDYNITGGSGTDIVNVGKGNHHIDGGDGDNNISVGNTNNGDTYIYTGSGDDTINIANGHVTVRTGSGTDTVTIGENEGTGRKEIQGDDGDKTITTGAGNDYINIHNGHHLINAGNGDNEIIAGDNTSETEKSSIITGSGDDNISVGDGGYNINAGNGSNTISAGSGDDDITVGNGTDRISAGDGLNIITAGNGKKTVTVGNSTVTDPEDDNYNLGSTITLNGSNNESEIETGTGDDTININSNSSHQIKITSEGGDNTINIDTNGLMSAIVTMGDGDDTFINDGHMGQWNDSRETNIDLGDGDNTVTIARETYKTTVETGSGDDTITIKGHGLNNTVNAGNGNNKIKYATYMTGWNDQDGIKVTAGSGNDEITIGSFDEDGKALGSVGNNDINAGGGNNTIKFAYTTDSEITTGAGNDTIEIAKTSNNGSYRNEINAGGGENTITLGRGDHNIITTEGDGKQTITVGVTGNSNDYNEITTEGGNDEITVIGSDNTIDAGAGENTISVTGNDNNITTGNDVDSITATGNNNEIYAGNGDNIITATGQENKIYTGSGADSITAGTTGGSNKIFIGDYDEEAEEVLVEGGTHNTVTLGNSSYNEVYIYNTQIEEGKKNTINIDDSGRYNTIKVMNGHTQINGGKSYNNTVTTGDGDDTITMNGGSNTINAGNGTNIISTDMDGAIVTTGTGNDQITLTGESGGGAEIDTGAGNDTITIEGNLNTSTISAGEGTNSITAAEITSSTITAGDDADTINILRAAGDTINLGDGKNTITLGDADNIDSSGNTIRTGEGDDEVYVYGAGGNNKIYAGNGDNSVHLGLGLEGTNNPSTVTVTTGTGNDTIVIGNFDEETGETIGVQTDVEIYAGSGANTLIAGDEAGRISFTTEGDAVQTVTIGTDSFSNTITTGGGDDVIKLAEGGRTYNNTINAGEGDNTIVVGDGSKYGHGDTDTYGNTITTGTGDDIITVGGHGRSSWDRNTIIAGNGHNIINVAYGSTTISAGDSTVTDPDDENYNIGSEITIGGEGTDSSSTGITTGSGDDIITITGKFDSSNIDAGSGDNVININADIEGDTSYSVSSTIIKTGSGDDSITIGKNDGRAIVRAGDGDNYVVVEGSNFTIETGSGKDTIVAGYDNMDKSYGTVNIGAYDDEEEIVTTEGGVENTVTIKGSINSKVNIYNTQIVDGKENVINFSGGSRSGSVNVLNGHTRIDFGDGEGFSATTGAGDDTFTNFSDNMSILAGDGDNTITMNEEQGSGIILTTGSGEDTVTIYGSSDVETGDGADVINVNVVSEEKYEGEPENRGYYSVGATLGGGNDVINLDEDYTGYLTINMQAGDGQDRVVGFGENAAGLRINVAPDVDYIIRQNSETPTSMDVVLIKDGEETGDVLTIDNIYKPDSTEFNDFITSHSWNYYIGESYLVNAATTVINGDKSISGLIEGTDNAESIYGSDLDDTIKPKNGTDSIRPGKGNDVIDLECKGGVKEIHFNKGEGNLTIKNTDSSSDIHLYFEGLADKATWVQKHGSDLVMVNSLGETLTVEGYFVDDSAEYAGYEVSAFMVKLYDENGEYYDYPWSYPNGQNKAIYVYPSDTGLLVPAARVYNNVLFTDETTTTIKAFAHSISDRYTTKIIGQTTPGDQMLLDLSWCSSDGYCHWIKDEITKDLTIEAVIDNTVDPEDMWDESNIATIVIDNFFAEYNTVNKFKFGSYTRDYTSINQLTQYINSTTDEGETLEDTWLNDIITAGKGDDTIITTGGKDKVYGNEGDDTIYLNNLGGTVDGGKGENIYYTFGAPAGNHTIVTTSNQDTLIIHDTLDTGLDIMASDGLVATVSYDDVIIQPFNFMQGQHSWTIKDALVKDIDMTIEDEQGFATTVKTVMANSRIFVSGENIISGTDYDDYIVGFEGNTEIRGNKGSDNITAYSGTNVFTYQNPELITDVDSFKDTTPGTFDVVNLYGITNAVYAQSETNIINSHHLESDDNYYAYLDQTTNVKDNGGDDSFTLMNTYGTHDGALTDIGERNLNILFDISSDFDKTTDTFDVVLANNIQTINWMDSFQASVEVKGITITDNAIETITTAEDDSGNAYTISSDNLKEIASEAASWLSNNGWTDVATLMESSSTDRTDFVEMVQATASNYWELV